MKKHTLTAATACTALLVGGLTVGPAHADTVTPAPAATSLTLNLSYAGKASQVQVSGVTTVGEAIAQLKLTVDSDDRVTPSTSTVLSDSMAVVIDLVSTKTWSKKVALKRSRVYIKTNKLYAGERKTSRVGVEGRATRTYQRTTVNGVATTVVIKEKVHKKMVSKIRLVGTKSTKGLNLARMSSWNKIAKCESGGRWSINTGNGYYGGLQFSLATWRWVKGQQFAKYPHQATKGEQVTVANRLYAKRGFQPWSCRRVL